MSDPKKYMLKWLGPARSFPQPQTKVEMNNQLLALSTFFGEKSCNFSLLFDKVWPAKLLFRLIDQEFTHGILEHFKSLEEF